MKYVLSLICLFSLFSCVSNRDAIRRSTIKFEGSNTTIRDLIEIDGYYSDSPEETGAHMFFEDGTYVLFYFQSESSEKERQTNMFKTIETWKGGKQIRWGVYWGMYAIQNDTIILHRYLKPNWFATALHVDELRFKVIDRNTVKGIYSRINSKAMDHHYETHSPWKEGYPIYFIPADSLPPSDCWLKERKWAWRNKLDWKEYKQMIKQKIKKFKRKEVKTYY